MEALCSCCREEKEIAAEEIVHRYWCKDCLDIARKEEIKERTLWDRIEMRQLMLSMFKDLYADDKTFHELAEKGLIDKKYDFPVRKRYEERVRALDIFNENKEFWKEYNREDLWKV